MINDIIVLLLGNSPHNNISWSFSRFSSHYEKFADGTVVCIDDEIPFEIPESWQWVRLNHIADIQSSKRVFEKDYVSDGIPFFRSKEIGDLSRNEIIQTKLYISKEHYEDLKAKYGVPQVGDILLTSVGSIGNYWICDGREFYYKDGNITQICSNAYFDSIYLTLFLGSPFFFQQITSSVSGTAYNALTIIKLKSLLFPLPPLAEQHRIVEKIQDLLPVVEQYDNTQSKLDTLNTEITPLLRKSILQEAIQGKLVPQDPDDVSASDLLQRIKEEKLRLVKDGKLKKKDVVDSVIFKGDDNRYFEKIGKEVVDITSDIPFEIPESWEWVRLSNVAQVNPKNDAPDSTIAAFIPMEKIDATYLSSYSYAERKWGEIKSGFTHFANGDVAFAKITPCFQNRKSMILKELPNGIGAGTTELKVLRPYVNTLSVEYLLFFLESPYFIEEATFKGTANQQRIISGYMESKLFPLPPLKEQKRIAEKVKDVYKRIGL